MKIALYDIDYTLIPFDSFFVLFFKLIKDYPINILRLIYLLPSAVLTGLKLKTLTDFKSDCLVLLKDLTDDELDILSKEFVEKYIIPNIKDSVRENIENNRNNGFKIVFATASFEFYLKYLAQYFNTDFFLGTVIEGKNNRRRIKGLNCKGQEKIERINKVIKLTDIKKDESVSFSDSMTDFPFSQITSEFNLVDKKKWEVIKTYRTD